MQQNIDDKLMLMFCCVIFTAGVPAMTTWTLSTHLMARGR
jgi:hypothetical protein